jgi:hypothetical protein
MGRGKYLEDSQAPRVGPARKRAFKLKIFVVNVNSSVAVFITVCPLSSFSWARISILTTIQ